MITRPNDPALSWTQHPIDGNYDISDYHLFALLGHYLVILPWIEGYPPDIQEEETDSMRLMVMDLIDHSVQKTKIKDSIHFIDPGCVSTLTTYKENRVIKVDGHEKKEISMWLITFESFARITLFFLGSNNDKALSVKCEHIQDSRFPKFQYHNAQFYKDCLYTYGEKSKNREDRSELWSFNFDSLTWSQLEQEKGYWGEISSIHLSSQIYQNYLILLGNIYSKYSDRKLFCWNINNNTWSVLETNSAVLYEKLIVYEDSLLAFHQEPHVKSLNLERVPVLASEKERVRSLFMSEKESDLMLNVENQIIYAHKEILMKKSEFFSNMFESGMAESRQKVIEIPGFEYLIFKEFLRFLYYEEIHIEPDENLVMKLYICSDFFLQNDLSKGCLEFLFARVNLENVFFILDFASQRDLNDLQRWCIIKLYDKITVDNIRQVITYVNQKYDPQEVQVRGSDSSLDREVRSLRFHAFDFLISNSKKINEKEQDLKIYEDFLMTHIGIVDFLTVLRFASDKKIEKQSTSAFKQVQANLKDALFNFAKENFQELKEQEMTRQFKHADWVDYTSWLSEKYEEKISQMEKEYEKRISQLEKENQELKKINTSSAEKELIEENEKKPEKSSSSRKRTEPSYSTKEVAPEEKPELKKTKKY